MRIIDRILRKIQYMRLKKIKPEIIGGYKNQDGTSPINTGISNMTHISQKDENLFIGKNVFIGHFNYIDAFNDKITISDNVQITNYVSILTHSSHHEIRLGIIHNKPDTQKEILLISGVYIGANSYIGPHSVIMPGSRIGKGCIVSAYSYIKGDYPDFSIIRGIPGKVIGSTKSIDANLLLKHPEYAVTYYLNNETL